MSIPAVTFGDEAYESFAAVVEHLRGFRVDLVYHPDQNTGYPTEGFIISIDDDGDIRVAEVIGGNPSPNTSFAIPNYLLQEVRVV